MASADRFLVQFSKHNLNGIMMSLGKYPAKYLDKYALPKTSKPPPCIPWHGSALKSALF